jgi:hypothetical protein
MVPALKLGRAHLAGVDPLEIAGGLGFAATHGTTARLCLRAGTMVKAPRRPGCQNKRRGRRRRRRAGGRAKPTARRAGAAERLVHCSDGLAACPAACKQPSLKRHVRRAVHVGFHSTGR